MAGTTRQGILPLLGHALVAAVAVVRSRRMPALRAQPARSKPRTLPPTDPRAHRSGVDAREREAAASAGATSWWGLFARAASQWMAHKDARLGAALAYYSVFSIGPLVVIAMAIAGLLFGDDAVRGEVSARTQRPARRDRRAGGRGHARLGEPPRGGHPRRRASASATLLFAAIGVVVQLKDALNTVWEVRAAQAERLWGFVRTYVLSLAGVLRLVSCCWSRCWSPRRSPPPEISRRLSAGSRTADVSFADFVRRHRRAVRHDVQVAARRRGRVARRLARRGRRRRCCSRSASS